MDLKRLFFEENVGSLDLWVRSFVGSVSIVVLALGLVPSPWNWLVGLLAFGRLFTAMTRHCTPYGLIGFTTAKK